MRISGWFSRMFGLWAEAFKSYKSSESPSSRQQTVAHAVTVETPEMSSLWHKWCTTHISLGLCINFNRFSCVQNVRTVQWRHSRGWRQHTHTSWRVENFHFNGVDGEAFSILLLCYDIFQSLQRHEEKWKYLRKIVSALLVHNPTRSPTVDIFYVSLSLSLFSSSFLCFLFGF